MTGGRFDVVMRQAIAVGSRHHPHPNPRVGAVLVDHEGRVIAEQGHARPGDVHAERALLQSFGPLPDGAVLVVTLEPCVHTGRTPPCTEAIIASGVGTVVVGAGDPDPRVAGRGIEALRAAGIDVVTDVETAAVEAADPGYFHHRRFGWPLVTLKQAVTLDGQIAAADGSSQWITGPEARADAHRLRAAHDAVLVGAGTLRSDDPRLDVRLDDHTGPQPVPVIVAGTRPLPAHLRIWERNPIVVASDETVLSGVEVMHAGTGGVVDLRQALVGLGERGILSVLAEGGAGLAAGLWSAGVVGRGVLYIGAKLAGGMGRGAFDRVFATLDDAVDIEIVEVSRLGADLRLDWRPRPSP
ncbi:MAG TPA: bifunctional diaminohydroxyphosphoribosylaminopyrimidine deaminase/5-amino-6-(5-phosphoribosylamino)uracil reductase RibD [Acidimicrobiia bacterium]|nr:bifunctional diaminohydroxyphosphoribosylaminopyrimidine deaminase/5-amino-6-(5-phosphoribosylamino)uracil reductase RibD [Acidimicrobiia bacterium]